MDVFPPWFFFVTTPVLAAALFLLFRWIFSLDDDPRLKAGTIYIPLRPLPKFIAPLFVFCGAGVLIGALDEFILGDRTWPWTAIFGLMFAGVAGVMGNTHLWLDEEGVHYRDWMKQVQTIAWDNLDHYDMHSEGNGQTVTVYYTFRSRDGSSIAIARSSYDIHELLQKIRARKDVAEQPYKPKSWFDS